MRILVVGGVAGGASCAARARRLNEAAEIVVFERGPHVSFANCGLPYYVGNVIQQEKSLLVATPELFKARFNIEVRTENEVIAVHRQNREIEVKNLQTGQIYRERYDVLVLAPGAKPIRPPLPGVDLPGIFVLRSIPDSTKIRVWISQHNANRAVVVGAGLIGLEMAENLVRLGMQVTILEMLDQVLPPLDPEMAEWVRERLVQNGVTIHLSDGVSGFEQDDRGTLIVHTKSSAKFPADMAVLSIGVRPEAKLAIESGLEIGELGGIKVDEAMRTSDPQIWAVGDAVESRDFVTGASTVAPLAGPANRQGRIAADSICGRQVRFRGIQSTAVVGIFGLTVAMTGVNEKMLRRSDLMAYEVIYLHPGHHVAYYPGAKPIHIKLIFSKADGRIFGAQAVGDEGVERRIDVIAMAIQKKATVFDLEEAELCYAPQYGAAKDPVNMAGMVASNVMRGDLPLAPWDDVSQAEAFLLDVRDPIEYEASHIENAINLPLPQLRNRIEELPRDRPILVYCGVGQRSYYAIRVLLQHGFQLVRNLPGGFTTFRQIAAHNSRAKGVVA